jgi:hypothetical protein
MRAISHLCALAFAAVPLTLACDDTARDVKREAAEDTTVVPGPAAGASARAGRGAVVIDIDSQKVKEELLEAGAALKKGAENAADAVKQAVDEADKDAARSIRSGEGGAH